MSPETVTVELPIAVYADLESLAEDEQTEPGEMVARLVKAARYERQAEPSTRAFRKILERATDFGITDLAEQHDHYLYGTDKK
jgi:hypothetical protein